MKLPRFKIRTLLGLVLWVAIAVAAMRAADDLWDSGMLGLTLLSLMTAVLLAVHRTNKRRAYWLGFALFGWVYLLVSLIPQIGSRLPTTKGLAFIDSKIPGRETAISAVFAYTNTYNPVQAGGYTPQVYTPNQNNLWVWDTTMGKLMAGPTGTTENFIHIGHSLLALVLAFAGGHLSRHLYDRGREERSNPPSDSPASP